MSISLKDSFRYVSVDLTGKHVMLCGNDGQAVRWDIENIPKDGIFKQSNRGVFTNTVISTVVSAKWNPHPQASRYVALNHRRANCTILKHLDTQHAVLVRPRDLLLDIAWSTVHSEVIVGCYGTGIMSFWDFRTAGSPFLEVGGMSADFRSRGTAATESVKGLVAWNTLRSNLVASVHNSVVQLWDVRRGTCTPLCSSTIMSGCDIHSLEWSPTVPYQLATGCEVEGMYGCGQIWTAAESSLELMEVLTFDEGSSKVMYAPQPPGQSSSKLVAIHAHSVSLWEAPVEKASRSAGSPPIHVATYELGHQLSGCAWRVSHEDTHLLALVPSEKKMLVVGLSKLNEPASHDHGDDALLDPTTSGDDADLDKNETEDTLHPLSERRLSGIAGPGGVRVSSTVVNNSSTPLSWTASMRHTLTPEFRPSTGHPPLSSSNFSLYGDGHPATHRPKFSAASASGSMGHLKNISSAHSFGTQSSGEDVGLFMELRDSTPGEKLVSSKLAQASSGRFVTAHGDAAINNKRSIAVALTELKRPVPPYRPGDRFPFHELLADQPPIPPPRFCGARFSIGGQLVVFSNVNPTIVSIGEGTVCEPPRDTNAVSLWHEKSTHEQLELHLSRVARECAEMEQRKSSRKSRVRHKKRAKPPLQIMAGVLVDPESDDEDAASDTLVETRFRPRNRKVKRSTKSRTVLYGAGMRSPLLNVTSPTGTGAMSYTDEDTNTDEPEGHWRYDGPQNPNETSDDAGFSPATGSDSSDDDKASGDDDDGSSDRDTDGSGALETKSAEDIQGLPSRLGRVSRRVRSADNFGDNKSTGSSSGSGTAAAAKRFTVTFQGVVQIRDCSWAVAESEVLASSYTIGLPASSRQPAHGKLYAHLREQLGHAVPLENDGSTCVPEKLDDNGVRAHSSEDEHVTVSMLCRHNARAANNVGKPGTAQTWLLVSDMVGMADSSLKGQSGLHDLKESLECSGELLQDEMTLHQKLTSPTAVFSSKPLFHVDPPPSSVLNCKRRLVTEEMLWTHHPFGQPLLKSLLGSLERVGDVQTLAVMSCVLESEARRTEGSGNTSSTPDLSQASSAREGQSSEPQPFMIAGRTPRRSSTMSNLPDDTQPVALPPALPITHSVSLTHYQPNSPQRHRSSQHEGIALVTSKTVGGVPSPLPHVHSNSDFETSKTRLQKTDAPAFSTRQLKPQPLRVSTVIEPQFVKATRVAVVREDDFVVGSLPVTRVAMKSVGHPEPPLTSHDAAVIVYETSPTDPAVKGLQAMLLSPPTSPHSVKRNLLTPVRRSIRLSLSPAAESLPTESAQPPVKQPVKLLPPEFEERANMYRNEYGNILMLWGRRYTRAEVLKQSVFRTHSPPARRFGFDETAITASKRQTRPSSSIFSVATPRLSPLSSDGGLAFVITCLGCQKVSEQPYCASCKRSVINCSVCTVAVKGLCTLCPSCGHGGHTVHLADWFATESECPTGCGCLCVENTIQASREVEEIAKAEERFETAAPSISPTLIPAYADAMTPHAQSPTVHATNVRTAGQYSPPRPSIASQRRNKRGVK